MTSLELQHCTPEKKGDGHFALGAGTGEVGGNEDTLTLLSPGPDFPFLP